MFCLIFSFVHGKHNLTCPCVIQASESSPPYPLACRGGGKWGDGPGHPKQGGHPKSETAKIKVL